VSRAVVFLDIDGVCNHQRLYDARKASERPWPLASDWIDRECVARVDHLCARSWADVVISSSWRAYATIPGASLGFWRGAAEVLQSCGLTANVIGATPDHRTQAMRDAFEHAPRWPEIAEWITGHPWAEQWVIIDDCEMLGVPADRHVRTDIAVGLTDADAERAIAILTRPE